MTQVISLLRNGVIHHFSDRLLVVPVDESAPLAHDVRSNKSLAVFTERSIGVIGYAGRSKIAGRLSDDWLAGAVCSDVAEWHRPPAQAPDLPADNSQVARRLAGHIERHLSVLNASVALDFELLVQYVGYAMRRGRTIPFVFRIEKHRGAREVSFHHIRDSGEWIRSEHIVCTPELARAERAVLADDLALSRSDESSSWSAGLRAMTRAAERPTVGPAFLALRLQPFKQPVMVVTFNGDGFDASPIGRNAVTPVAYVPWVLTPWGVASPAVASDLTMRLGHVELQVTGVPPAVGPVMSMVYAPHRRRPSTGAPTTLDGVGPSESFLATQELDARVTAAVRGFEIELGHSRGGDGMIAYAVRGLATLGAEDRQRLARSLEDLRFPVLVRDSDSGEVFVTGEWSDDERSLAADSIRRDVEQGRELQQWLDALAEISTSFGVAFQMNVSYFERDARTVLGVTGLEAPLAGLRLRRATEALCRLSVEEPFVLRLSSGFVEQQAAVVSRAASWTLEELGFHPTTNREEPFRFDGPQMQPTG